MSNAIGLFGLAIASASMMAISQKMLMGYSSYRSYVVANGVIFGLTMLAWGWFGSSDDTVTFSPWMIVLGVSVGLLNFAYIWIYQSGVALPYVPIIVTGVMTAILTVVGVLYFRDAIGVYAMMGMGVIVVGLALIVYDSIVVSV